MIKRILLVDDDEGMLDVLGRHLRTAGFAVSACVSGEHALLELKKSEFSAVVTDLKMPGLNGVELCDRIAGNHPDLPVLILTAFGTLETAVEAIRAGAYDFIVKPVNLDALTSVIERAIRNQAARKQIRRLEAPEVERIELPADDFIGESRASLELRTLIGRLADLQTSVLVTGESGTGKELVAKSLHRRSDRRGMPFVVVSCASIPEDSFEEILFGRSNERGVAVDSDSFGLVGAAAGGTLFFDEIVHLPPKLQPKLLRLLEERLYRPIGSREEILCTARFVVASSANLDDIVKAGGVREDLLFRINVMHLTLSPLRDRGGDILLLARHFLKYFAARLGRPVQSLAEPVTEKLVAYKWPGNVRELRNAIERAVAVAQYDHIVVEDLPEPLRRFKVSTLFSTGGREELVPVDVVEQRHILGVLKELGGNKASAAKVLGLDRKTLYRKLERYGYDD